MQAREQDFVSRLVQIAQAVTGMDDTQAALLEDEIRHEFGGDTGYVAATSRAMAEARNKEIVEAVTTRRNGAERMTVAEAARHYSVSRKHVYELLKG